MGTKSRSALMFLAVLAVAVLCSSCKTTQHLNFGGTCAWCGKRVAETYTDFGWGVYRGNWSDGELFAQRVPERNKLGGSNDAYKRYALMEDDFASRHTLFTYEGMSFCSQRCLQAYKHSSKESPGEQKHRVIIHQ